MLPMPVTLITSATLGPMMHQFTANCTIVGTHTGAAKLGRSHSPVQWIRFTTVNCQPAPLVLSITRLLFHTG